MSGADLTDADLFSPFPSEVQSRPTWQEAGHVALRGGIMGCVRRTGWWAGAGVIVLAACRQIVGIGDTPPMGNAGDGGVADAADAGPCGPALASGACETCMQTACCSQAAACAADPGPCSDLETCLGACGGDAACRAQCVAAHGLGNDRVTPPLEACLASQCSGPCGLQCGGLAALFPAATAVGCEQCIEKNACEDMIQCATDPACQATLRCLFASDTVDVNESCGTIGDAGTIAVAASAAPPVGGACAGPCSWGNDWSCVGKVSFPGPSFGPIEITAVVNMGMPAVPGATVRLCDRDDPPCLNPIATAPTVTDANGKTTLVRPAITEEPRPYYLDVTGPGIIETLLFWFFPLSQQSITIPVAVTSPLGAEAVAANVSVTADLDAGTVLADLADCRGAGAQGARLYFVPQDGGSPFYYWTAQLLPDPTVTSSSASGEGLAVAFSVPTGSPSLVLSADAPADGGSFGAFTFVVRPGVLSEVYLMPSR